MSQYTRYYKTRKNMYTDMAARWKKWSETTEVSDTDKKGISMFFESIAKRFGLKKKFKNIGVL